MNPETVKALFYPFGTGVLKTPSVGDAVLFINAAVAIPKNFAGAEVAAVQWHKPAAALLEGRGMNVTSALPEKGGGFDMALLLGTKQHAESRYYLARALSLLKPGGTLVAAAENRGGGNRLKGDFSLLGLTPQEDSKHKCRIVRAVKEKNGDEVTLQSWIVAGSLQKHPATGFYARPGLFSWDRVDAGSALLAAHLPPGLSGAGADFGCGYGYLGVYLLNRYPAITALSCADADARALQAAEKNLEAHGAKSRFYWHDLAAGPPQDVAGLDWIIMNPPFHEGREVDLSLGAGFIKTAAAALRRGGALWMVANRHLPYEAVLQPLFSRITNVATEKGFKIVHAIR